jgi:hypothetical protein
MRVFHWRLWFLTALLLGGAPGVYADVVTDANQKSADIASRHPATPISVRMMAIVQVSVFEGVNAISGRYPTFRVPMSPAPGASMDAAVAAAMRTALLKLMPAQQAAIDADYQALLAGVPDGPAKASGIAVGEQAATPCGVVRQRWQRRSGHVSPAHDPWSLRPHGDTRRPALGQAQAVAHGPPRPVPAGAAARLDE